MRGSSYSEDQLRDFATRVAWEMMDDETREQMMATAKASLQVAEDMNVMWSLPDVGKDDDGDDYS